MRLVEELGLNDEHFDAVMEDLGSALKELGVPDDLIAEAERRSLVGLHRDPVT